MPRPVKIDRETAKRAATRLFWLRGYGGTPMSELLDAMGMGGGSFYAAYGSKAQLFEQILGDYVESSVTMFKTSGGDAEGLDAIRAFLNRSLVDLPDRDRRKGCLLVNASLELEEDEPALHRAVSDGLATVEAAIRDRIKEAQELGTLRGGVTEKQAVGVLMSLLLGLRVESRHGLSRTEARRRIDTTLELLGSER